MGSIVGAALVSHVPTIMLSADVRKTIGGGRDTTLVEGLRRVQQRMHDNAVDTVIIVDTHWFTTAEHIVAGGDHLRGHYTSDELPKVIRKLPYDYRGAPELAAAIARIGAERGQWVLNAKAEGIEQHYPTINIVHHIVSNERVLSTGVCQTAEIDDFLEFGSAIAAAVEATEECRVAILASGGLSHRFWSLRQFRERCGFGPEHVITAEARHFDERLIGLMEAGDHRQVIDLVPAFRAHAPEGHFGHYLTMVGALGGRECTARGERLSDYESSYGTGQVDVWFDLDRKETP